MEVSSIFLLGYILVSLLLALTYLFIILFYRRHWEALPYYELPRDFTPKTHITVVIPARNEQATIANCLQSIRANNYPEALLEVIVVDDHSYDKTAARVQSFHWNPLRLLALEYPLQGKKQAISYAVSQAAGELILTTDADCRVPEDWLRFFAAVFQDHEPGFIAAPVVFDRGNTPIEHFQSLDFMGMMLITGAGIESGFMRMSNGANLGYPKRVFEAIKGFDQIDHLASGDDLLLMHKIAQRFPDDIFFIKNPKASVHTSPMPDVSSFLQQRIRWGTKSAYYQEWRITVVLAMVFFFCWSIIGSLILGIFWTAWLLLLFAVQLTLKIIVDYFFLRQASRFFKRQSMMKYFFSAQALHIWYITYVGLLSNLYKTYTWKGRRVR